MPCRIDDGLELRKAAFECMDMLVDACPDRLSFPAFLTHLESGLKVLRCLPAWNSVLSVQNTVVQCIVTVVGPGSVSIGATDAALPWLLAMTYGSGGGQDHYDVKMPCHSLLAKLAAGAGEHVRAHLARLVPPLEATLTAKVKSDAVKQEVRPPARRLCAGAGMLGARCS